MHDIIEASKITIIEAFNNKIQDGIKILNDICLKNDLNKSEQLAELFLQENAQLNLDHVGDYLSGPDDEHKNTLKYFTSKMDFKDKSFIPAMREYLKTFKLPGEGQKIDRVVEAFGARYYDQNPNKDGIANKDAAYILAYQVIMLNSDLHKPASKDKMSLDDLKRNLRGLNEQNDFSKELLTHIYDDIQANPFEFNFVEIPPKYVLSGKELSSNKTFSQLDSCFSVGNFEVTDIFPELKNDNASYAVNISHPKSFLNRFGLTGYQGEMQITEENGDNTVGIEFYKPSLFGGVPEVTVRAIPKEGSKQINESAIELAATIAAGFSNMEIETVHATYDYLGDSLAKAYTSAKARDIGKSLQSRIKTGSKRAADIMRPVHKIKKPYIAK